MQKNMFFVVVLALRLITKSAQRWQQVILHTRAVAALIFDDLQEHTCYKLPLEQAT